MRAPRRKKKDRPRRDGDWVFVPYFRHYRTGKIVYPKRSKVFRFRRRK